MKLNQILATEKGIKNRNETTLSKESQAVLKGDLLSGFVKKYTPLNEEGEKFPTEAKKVQVRAEDTIKKVSTALKELFDITAIKDLTNCVAKGDIIVDGVTILAGVPATHLLFIEKQLVWLTDFVKKLPVLDASEDWKLDPNQGLNVTAPVSTMKSKKVEGFILMVPATKEFPAQTKNTVTDAIVGSWETVKFSGALPADRVDAVAERIEKLTRATKYAREAANAVEAVTSVQSGAAILGYVFG
jgi:hypothetical protein